jgi:hypothetical protein
LGMLWFFPESRKNNRLKGRNFDTISGKIAIHYG